MENIMTNKPITAEALKGFEEEINQIGARQRAQVGEQDARYIRNMIRIERSLEMAGRLGLVLGCLHPLWWIVGVLALRTAKRVNNTEVGHNVTQSQYDFMNEPNINGEFDGNTIANADSWRRYHNYEPHTYTNIIGKDRDY